MTHIDVRRSMSRRDSSLIMPRGPHHSHVIPHQTERQHLPRVSINTPRRLNNESGHSWGAIREELITSLFESMVDTIVDSWEGIPQEDSSQGFEKYESDVTVANKKKKTTGRVAKSRRRSKSELHLNQQCDPIMQTWWFGPDEKAVIYFKNGNVYEGDISMKCMHGEGRMLWADGTVYSGQFRNNEIVGKGNIKWKDDTWYTGEFAQNVRHGHGMYTDSRSQRYYIGGWYGGTKDGKGFISYGHDNYYDGDWTKNIRHGIGTREYSAQSGYVGQWKFNVRDGDGIMIWPNCDFYTGGWENGVMHGNGYYVWDAVHNNSMSLPSQNSYRGGWEHGLRQGYGILKLGFGLGSQYKGQFNKNLKDGYGKIITNNGMVLEDNYLFCNDIFGLAETSQSATDCVSQSKRCITNPYEFNICDNTVGLMHHIKVAIRKIRNLEKEDEITANMINDFIENNTFPKSNSHDSNKNKVLKSVPPMIPEDFNELLAYEEDALRKALRYYERELKDIYYTYATICNTKKIDFTPKLIRLYMWQLYNDINIRGKGFTLVQIDDLFHANKKWLSKKPHDPFERIFFWQFLHHLISVSNLLYGKRHLPGRKPDTMAASAFRKFIETDLLPARGAHTGRLTQKFGRFVPLQGLYKLYCRIGEPHTVRQFLNAVKGPIHCIDQPQPELVEAADDSLPIGRNVYLYGDTMKFSPDKKLPVPPKNEPSTKEFPLFNFHNLSSKTILKHFSHILPQVCKGDLILDLDVQITFYEFFEVFVACAEDSVRVKEKEIRFRQKFFAIPDSTSYRSCSRLFSAGSRHTGINRVSSIGRTSIGRASIGRASIGRLSISRASSANINAAGANKGRVSLDVPK